MSVELPPAWFQLLDQHAQPGRLSGQHARATLQTANRLVDVGGAEWRNPKPLLVRQAQRIALAGRHALYLAYWRPYLLPAEAGSELALVLPERVGEVWAAVHEWGKDPGEGAYPAGFHCWLWRSGRRNGVDGPVVCDWSSSWCP